LEHALSASCPRPPAAAGRPCCAQVNDLADSFKRSLAEMENLRQRTSRQVENAQKFAVEVRARPARGGGAQLLRARGFGGPEASPLSLAACFSARTSPARPLGAIARLARAWAPRARLSLPKATHLGPLGLASLSRARAQPVIKSLLDVADNLQRAAEAVPPGVLDGSEQLDAERAQRLLKSLAEGVALTDGVLMKARRGRAPRPPPARRERGGPPGRAPAGGRAPCSAARLEGHPPTLCNPAPRRRRSSRSTACSSTTRRARSSTPTCTRPCLRSQTAARRPAWWPS
jgi:hypothetical protein